MFYTHAQVQAARVAALYLNSACTTTVQAYSARAGSPDGNHSAKPNRGVRTAGPLAFGMLPALGGRHEAGREWLAIGAFPGDAGGSRTRHLRRRARVGPARVDGCAGPGAAATLASP